MAVTANDIILTKAMNTAAKTVTLTDATVYSNYGITDSWVLGYFVLTGPAGVYYANANAYTGTPFATPDIDGSLPDFSATFNLPVDSNGNVAPGTYTFSYFVGVFEPGQPSYTVNNVSTTTLTIVPPAIKIEQDADCWCPTFTSKDLTNYNVPNVTIQSQTTVHTIIYPTDTTTNQPVIADLVSATPIIVDPKLYTGGVYTTTIETDITYLFPNGTTVSYTLIGQKTKLVKCEYDICNIKGCLANLTERYHKELCTNPGEAQKTQAQLLQVVALLAQAELMQGCGSGDDVSAIICKIKAIFDGLGCGCGCPDGSTVDNVKLVSGFCGQTGGGGGGGITTLLAGYGIILTPTTGGYTVAVNSGTIGSIAVSAMAATITSIQGDIVSLQTQVNDIITNKYFLMYDNWTGVLNVNGGASDLMQTYDVPSEAQNPLLFLDDDKLRIDTTVLRRGVDVTDPIAYNSIIDLKVGGVSICTVTMRPNSNQRGVRIKATLERLSSTTLRVQYEYQVLDIFGIVLYSATYDTTTNYANILFWEPKIITVPAMTLTPLNISVYGTQSVLGGAANQLNNTYLTAEIFKKY